MLLLLLLLIFLVYEKKSKQSADYFEFPKSEKFLKLAH